MNKKIIAIAIAAAMTAPVVAMADVKISGKGVFSLSKTNFDGATATQKSLQTNDTGSKIAIRGTAGDAYVHLENHLSIADKSDANTEQGFLGTMRFAWVGYKAGFGEVVMGSFKSPMKGATGSHDLFADSSGDHNSNKGDRIIEEAGYNQGDSIGLNMKAGGFKIDVAHNLASEGENTADTQISVSGKAGPVGVTAAIMSGGTSAAATYKSMTYLGGKMKFGKIGVNAQYQTYKDTADVKTTVSGLGVAMKAGNGKAKAQYMSRKEDSNNKTITSVGYDMGLGKGVGLGLSYSIIADNAKAKTTVLGVGLGVSF